MILRATSFILSVVIFAVAAYSPKEPTVSKTAFMRPGQILYPPGNPYTENKYSLGKKLFFDPLLSQSKTMSCATCHNPNQDWFDGKARSVGRNGHELPRKAATLLNVSWGWSFFWDGRARTLEEQALMPIQSQDEMNLSLNELEARLNANREYRADFAKAFPGEKISANNVARAIATFERRIVSGEAPFDRFISGDTHAISKSAQRGFELFSGKGSCVQCHSGWNFTNGSFADTGILSKDTGRGPFIDEPTLQFGFKTPTLRNIARRAPYMHDGSVATLLEVIEHYDQGGKGNREATKLFLKPLNLSAEEKNDLVSFLETLTEE